MAASLAAAAAVGPGRALDVSTPVTAWAEGVAEGAEALAGGDAARAEAGARAAIAARPAGKDGARAELILGLALRDGSRFDEAATALARAQPGLEPALAAAARFERAQALFYGGHPGVAAAELALVASTSSGSLARRARWREADALLQAGAPAAAARAYQLLLATDPGATAAPGARLSLAAAQRAAGDARGAVATYRALWIEHPADPAGRAAGQALRAWRQAGGAIPPATPEERLARAARLLQLALPRRVLAALDRAEAAGPPPEPATRAALLRALALLQLGRREEARALAERIQSAPAALGGTRVGAELVLARVAARSGRVDDAAARYRKLASAHEEVPGLTPAQARELPGDAAFLSAWIYFDARDYARAIAELRRYLRAHPGARRAEDARWFEAWSLYRLGRKGEARRALARLPGGLQPAALYWQARLADTAAQRRQLHREVLRSAPAGSWYALLSAGRLQAMGEAPPPLSLASPQPIPDGAGTGPAAPALERAALLLGAGLPGEAAAELRAVAASRQARDEAARIAQLAGAMGDAELPFRMARDFLPPTRRAQRWTYPLAFAPLVTESARAARIDPFLYLAVMRRESAFRPDARSGAGAVGLVQLIPPTAERLAAVHGLSRASIRRLELPEVSVPLGAAYLGLLASRFDDPALVLAAYNAGPPAVEAWTRDRAGGPLDEWVEDVSYRETRRYVRNVSADAAVYRAIWSGAPLSIDGSRPVPAPRRGVAF